MEYNINKNLQPDEEILWEGKPNIKLFHFCDIFILPVSTAFCGMFLFFSGIFLFNATIFSWQVLIFIILFMLSLYGVVGRTIQKAVTQSKTTHYITNQRAIIVKGLRKPKVRVKYINSMKEIIYKEQRQGRSRVVFDVSPFFTPLYANSGMEDMMSGASLYGQLPAAFYDIDDAKTVYDMVVKLRKEIGDE